MAENRLVTPDDKFGIVLVTASPLRISKSDRSEMISQLLLWEPIHILELCESWVKLKTHFDNYVGYADVKHIFPISKIEFQKWIKAAFKSNYQLFKIDTIWGNQYCLPGSFLSKNIDFEWCPDLKKIKPSIISGLTAFEKGKYFLNTPYLWGGKSEFGIDCSGFSQLIFGFFGISLMRDAYQQATQGIEISLHDSFEFALAFFTNEENKIIHVGIMDKNHQIIHASGKVRIDQLDEKGILNVKTKLYTHNLHSIRKYKPHV